MQPLNATIDKALPSLRWLIAGLVPLLILKAVVVFMTPPTADEAYYFMWGQSLDWSYYDHPPLGAWGLRLFAEVFGWNMVAMRAFPLATFAGSLAIMWYWSKRMAPDGKALRLFLAGVAVLLATPLYMRMQTIAQFDHLFIFTGMLAAHFLALFYETLDGEPRWRFLYAGAFAIGLAGLTKYNGVFFGLGLAAWIVFTARGRALLRSPHIWVAGALALAMQAPVLYWNILHDWPSFRYNLSARIGQNNGRVVFENYQLWLETTLMMLSPVTLLILMRMLVGSKETPTPFDGIGRMVFLVSTLAFAALCVTNTVLYYWNIAAYIFILPVLGLFLRSKIEFSISVIYGLTIGVWIALLHGIYPVYAVNGETLRDYDISYGLEEIAAHMSAAEKATGAPIVMTTDYRTAGLLAFTTRRSDIQKIGVRGDQYDFWFDQQAAKGKDAVVLVDDFYPESELLTQVFERVEPIETFTIRRFGYDIHTYRIVLARNYSGVGEF